MRRYRYCTSETFNNNLTKLWDKSQKIYNISPSTHLCKSKVYSIHPRL